MGNTQPNIQNQDIFRMTRHYRLVNKTIQLLQNPKRLEKHIKDGNVEIDIINLQRGTELLADFYMSDCWGLYADGKNIYGIWDYESAQKRKTMTGNTYAEILLLENNLIIGNLYNGEEFFVFKKIDNNTWNVYITINTSWID